MTATRRTPDVTIVGGGIIGCTLAWELTQLGASVEILERREIGQEASWASAGIISPPGPRHASRTDLALSAFRRYPDLIPQIEELSGMSAGYRRTGEVDLGTDADTSALREVLAWQQSNGVESSWLDQAALHEREPAVHERFTGGIYVPGAGSVILSRLTNAFARAATARGAAVREHVGVVDVQLGGGRVTSVRTFDGDLPVERLVIAAGAWSRAFGEMLDLAVPTVPVRGQMLAIADPPVALHSVIAGTGGYLVPRADGTVAVGATEEHESGFDDRVTPAGLAELHALIERVAPSLVHGRFLQAWAGLRPGSDDGELIVGRVPHLPNVWISTGHYRSGALLAPASAELLAPSILNGTAEPRLAAFDPARFAR